MMAFMLALQEHRERVGLSKGELSRASGVSRRTILRIEQNPDYEPGVLATHRIAKALGVTIDELLHDPEGTATAGAASK